MLATIQNKLVSLVEGLVQLFCCSRVWHLLTSLSGMLTNSKLQFSTSQTIDLRSLLLSIHGFFESLGVDEIRRRSHADDKPLRMVKTILHELCKLKGTDIYR